MTVISDTMVDIGHGPNVDALYIYAPGLRDSGDSTQIITGQWLSVPIAPAGTFTSPDLEPGPARVRIGGIAYELIVPDSDTPVRLWPLIDAAVPPPPDTAGFIRNGGGVMRAQVLTEAQYSGIGTPDPETLYIVVPNP